VANRKEEIRALPVFRQRGSPKPTTRRERAFARTCSSATSYLAALRKHRHGAAWQKRRAVEQYRLVTRCLAFDTATMSSIEAADLMKLASARRDTLEAAIARVGSSIDHVLKSLTDAANTFQSTSSDVNGVIEATQHRGTRAVHAAQSSSESVAQTATELSSLMSASHQISEPQGHHRRTRRA
jgi:methyl-accepting chemotaxis protein